MRARTGAGVVSGLLLLGSGCGSSGPVSDAASAARAIYGCDGDVTVSRPDHRPAGVKDIAVVRCGPESWLSPLVGVWVYDRPSPDLTAMRHGYDYGRFCRNESVVYYLYSGGLSDARRFCEQVGAGAPIRARDGR